VLKVRADLHGWSATKKLMRELEPETVREMDREIKAILTPIRDRARSLVPTMPPLSGWGRSVARPGSRPSYSPYGKRWDYARLEWNTSEARSNIVVGVGGRRKRGEVTRAAYQLRSNNAAAAVFEIMGRGKGGVAMARNVTRLHGRPSPGRILYKAWDEHRADRVVDKVRGTLKKYESDFQRRLDSAKESQP
jgi:hypothetical protein